MTKRYREIVNASRDAIICADAKGRITFFNDAAKQLFGYSCDEALGADLDFLLPKRFRAKHSEGFDGLAASGQSRLMGQIVEMVGLHRSGQEIPVELSLMKAGEGPDFELLGIIRDISALKELKNRLETISQTDYLTGLSNRHSFDRRLAGECEQACRHNKRLSLLLADLDHFKAYNKLHGRQAGDEALKAISKCICDAVPASDRVARYSGDELAVFLPETGHFEASALAENILTAVQNMGLKHSGFPEVGILTVSIGVAGFSKRCASGTDLVRRADEALCQAHAQGGNRVITETDLKKTPFWDI
jgi:diguanylate cyclase (GGDEF)-like protein/PAS domain S-box-containing protein